MGWNGVTHRSVLTEHLGSLCPVEQGNNEASEVVKMSLSTQSVEFTLGLLCTFDCSSWYCTAASNLLSLPFFTGLNLSNISEHSRILSQIVFLIACSRLREASRSHAQRLRMLSLPVDQVKSFAWKGHWTLQHAVKLKGEYLLLDLNHLKRTTELLNNSAKGFSVKQAKRWSKNMCYWSVRWHLRNGTGWFTHTSQWKKQLRL